MKKTVIPIVVSVALSLCLLSGVDDLSRFAFYVCIPMNVLVWLGILTGMVKGDVAARIRRTAWVNLPSSIFYVYALVFSGHPILAASSFMAQFLIMVTAFRDELSA